MINNPSKKVVLFRMIVLSIGACCLIGISSIFQNNIREFVGDNRRLVDGELYELYQKENEALKEYCRLLEEKQIRLEQQNQILKEKIILLERIFNVEEIYND